MLVFLVESTESLLVIGFDGAPAWLILVRIHALLHDYGLVSAWNHHRGSLRRKHSRGKDTSPSRGCGIYYSVSWWKDWRLDRGSSHLLLCKDLGSGDDSLSYRLIFCDGLRVSLYELDLRLSFHRRLRSNFSLICLWIAVFSFFCLLSLLEFSLSLRRFFSFFACGLSCWLRTLRLPPWRIIYKIIVNSSRVGCAGVWCSTPARNSLALSYTVAQVTECVAEDIKSCKSEHQKKQLAEIIAFLVLETRLSAKASDVESCIAHLAPLQFRLRTHKAIRY